MHTTFEIVAAIALFALGLSHVVQHQEWARFFHWLASRGRMGAWLWGGWTLLNGIVVVVLHPVWHGLSMMLTLFGWALVVKGLAVLLLPAWSQRSMTRIAVNASRPYAVAGWMLIALSGVLTLSLCLKAVG